MPVQPRIKHTHSISCLNNRKVLVNHMASASNIQHPWFPCGKVFSNKSTVSGLGFWGQSDTIGWKNKRLGRRLTSWQRYISPSLTKYNWAITPTYLYSRRKEFISKRLIEWGISEPLVYLTDMCHLSFLVFSCALILAKWCIPPAIYHLNLYSTGDSVHKKPKLEH